MLNHIARYHTNENVSEYSAAVSLDTTHLQKKNTHPQTRFPRRAENASEMHERMAVKHNALQWVNAKETQRSWKDRQETQENDRFTDGRRLITTIASSAVATSEKNDESIQCADKEQPQESSKGAEGLACQGKVMSHTSWSKEDVVGGGACGGRPYQGWRKHVQAERAIE